MIDIAGFFRRAGELAPHGYCLLWDRELVWTHVIADGLIAAAYFSIPVAIMRFVTKRKDIEFSWIFWLFALFIVACGTTHLMGIWTLWHADYAWQAVVKVVTAIVSVGTAIVLWPLIPRALAIPSPLQLRQANEELERRIAERDEALGRLRLEIEERERAEAALLQAQKMEAVGQLTGGIAHDFNNLLQAVSGMLTLIVRNPEDKEKVIRWGGHGLASVERGARLTGQLLAFSRVQGLDLRPVPVTALLRSAVVLASRSAGPQIAIHSEPPVEDLHVLADQNQLELALLNLAINARDAMPDGGRIVIKAGTVPDPVQEDFPAGAVEISVSDTGTGMSPEVVARAFEPFFTTKGTGAGTGLGLSMVYAVAKQSGGFARIESVEGEGTKVSIVLRRAEAGSEARPLDAPVEQAIPVGRNETILIVDDNVDVRAALRQSLESIGYVVHEARDGPEALAMLQMEAPALAIFDYAMPGMTGAEAAREAVKIRPGLKLIFASGYADSEALEQALGDQAPILRKPFQLPELAGLVAHVLSNQA